MVDDKAAKLADAKKRATLKKKKAVQDAGGSVPKKGETDPSVAGNEVPAAGEPASEAAVEEEAPAPPVASRASKTEDGEQPSTPKTDEATSVLPRQPKMRTASMRMGSISSVSGVNLAPGPLSPDGDTAADIYRKQAGRIDELERDLKRLAKEAYDSEKRWEKAEEELAELREADGDGPGKKMADELVEKLKNEMASLERQNGQLQQQLARNTSHRHSSPSVSSTTPPNPETAAQLASKSAVIETMELEISRLRAQADKGMSSEREQISLLEDKLSRADRTAATTQRELADLKRSLDRSAEKAVRDSSERTSAETRIRTLEHQLADAVAGKIDWETKAEALEKKVATLTTLHREQDSRMHALRREKEGFEKGASELRSKLDKSEADAARLRGVVGRKPGEGSGGLDDEGVDELENDSKAKLEGRIRELEGEVYELRRGAWQNKRREMGEDTTSPGGGGFQDVDLSGSVGFPPTGGHRRAPMAGGGLGDFFASGLNALTGGGQGQEDDDGLLDDDDGEFDEEAFQKAREEEMMQRMERLRGLKRALKDWEGWRIDVVEGRRGGWAAEGVGEIFEV